VAGTAPISPELALVTPDLAERARALLPDRPWERFLPPGPLEIVPIGGPPGAATPGGGRPHLVAYVPGLLLLALAVVIAIGSLSWFGDRPRLEPPPAHTGTVPAQPGGSAPAGHDGAALPAAR
jgi:hypothetical protein